jgi:hypothetical protein
VRVVVGDRREVVDDSHIEIVRVLGDGNNKTVAAHDANDDSVIA